MKIGQLNHRIKVEQLVIERDSDGSIIETWVDFLGHKKWAKIEYKSGKELLSADATQNRLNAKITVRKIKGINTSMRIEHKNVFFNIEAILDDPYSGNEYQVIHVYTGLNEH